MKMKLQIHTNTSTMKINENGLFPLFVWFFLNLCEHGESSEMVRQTAVVFWLWNKIQLTYMFANISDTAKVSTKQQGSAFSCLPAFIYF